MKKLTVVEFFVAKEVPLGADNTVPRGVVVTLETVVGARSTSTFSRSVICILKEVGPWDLALAATGSNGSSTITTCESTSSESHASNTTVPWAIVSSSINRGSFGTDTNSRHVVVRNAASTHDSVGIRGVDRSSSTISTGNGLTRRSSVIISFVKAECAIRGSGA